MDEPHSKHFHSFCGVSLIGEYCTFFRAGGNHEHAVEVQVVLCFSFSCKISEQQCMYSGHTGFIGFLSAAIHGYRGAAESFWECLTVARSV